MKQAYKQRWLCRLMSVSVTILIIAFIFGNSLQTADLSAQRSGSLLIKINEIMALVGIRLSEFVLRKMAHFGEFMMLGCSLFWTWKEWLFVETRKGRMMAVGAGFLVACTDELIQLFSEGRACRLMDVGIDTAGCAVGVIGVWIVYKRVVRK